MAADDAKLIAFIEANTRQFENALKRIERSVEGVSRNSQSSFRRIDTQLDTTARTAAKLNTTLLSVGKTFAGAFGIGIGAGLLTQLPAMMRDVVASAAKIGDVADKIGIATDALQALHHQAEQNNSSTGALDASLEQFARRTADAVNGTGELADILKANGVELRNTDGSLKSIEQRLADYADLIAGAANESDALVLAMAAFGRAGTDMAVVFRGGSEEIRKFVETAQRLGIVLDAGLIDRAQVVDDKFAQLTRTMTTFAKGEVLQFVGQLTDAIEDLGAAAEATGGFFGKMFPDDVQVARDLIANLAEIEDGIERGRNLAAAGLVPPDAVSEAQAQAQVIRDELARMEKESGSVTKAIGQDFIDLGKDIAKVAAELPAFFGGMRGGAGTTVLPTSGAAVSGGGMSADLIKQFEGYRSNAYWDVDHYRVGYGSNQMTSASGGISEVTSRSTTTIEAAERDLQRRIAEFQAGIIRDIGAAFGQLTEPVQAALTSVAYNYGSLPDSVAAAARTTDPEAIARSIEGLSANPARRAEEAELVRSSVLGLQQQHAATLQLSDAKAKLIADAERGIEALGLEAKAFGQTTFEAERAKVAFDLLNQAKAAGLEITPELEARINGLATAYANATVAVETLQVAEEQSEESQQALIERMDEFRAGAKDVLSGFVSDLRDGKTAAEALGGVLDSLADKLVDMALNNVISGLFGAPGTAPRPGGLLGGALIPGILHKGGIVGQDGYGHGRAVSPAVFAGAQRYHGGGIAGLRSGEVPAILQRGELVVPRMGRRGAPGGQTQTSRVENVVRVEPSPMFITTVDSRVQGAVRGSEKRMSGVLSEQRARFG